MCKYLALFGLGENVGVDVYLGQVVAGGGDRYNAEVSPNIRWLGFQPLIMLVTVAL